MYLRFFNICTQVLREYGKTEFLCVENICYLTAFAFLVTCIHNDIKNKKINVFDNIVKLATDGLIAKILNMQIMLNSTMHIPDTW